MEATHEETSRSTASELDTTVPEQEVGEERDPSSDSARDDTSETLDLTRLTRQIRSPLGMVAVATAGLFALAFFYTLYAARVLFLPIVLALFFDRLLSPLVRSLTRVRIPTPVGAGVVLLGLLGALGFGIYNLSGPASDWMEQVPQTLQRAEYKLRGLKEPVRKVQEAAEQMQEATRVQDEDEPEAATPERSVSEVLLSQTRIVLVGGMITFFLLYFLLASGDLFLRKLLSVLPEWRDKRLAVEITHRVERDLSTYLLTVTMINAVLGCAIGTAMWLLGMPNPVLWGIMGMALNFIPYLGAAIGVAVVGLVAIITFDTIGQAIPVPLVYLALTGLEGYLLTPMVLGRRFTINPVAIFLSLVLWGWIWGMAGALLAVPLLVAFKIFCENIDALKPLGAFLER